MKFITYRRDTAAQEVTEICSAYINATRTDIEARVKQLCKRPGWSEYKIAADFGCSKGNFSLVKRGEYGSEHGEEHRYATAYIRIAKVKELICLYDLFLVLQLHDFAKKSNLTIETLTKQLYSFALSPKYQYRDTVPIESMEDAESILIKYLQFSLPFVQRDSMDSILPMAIYSPLTMIHFRPAYYYFKHSAYHTCVASHRVKKTDSLTTYLQASDYSPEDVEKGNGWTMEQMLIYLKVRLNLSQIPKASVIPIEIYAYIPERSQMIPAKEIGPLLPQIRSSSISALNKEKNNVDAFGIAPSAPRRIRKSKETNSAPTPQKPLPTSRKRKRVRKNKNKKYDDDGDDESSAYSSDSDEEDEEDAETQSEQPSNENAMVDDNSFVLKKRQPIHLPKELKADPDYDPGKKIRRQTKFIPMEFTPSRRGIPSRDHIIQSFHVANSFTA